MHPNIEEYEYKGFNIKLEYDEPAFSPRDWDNLGFMACWHKNYNLGDIQDRIDPETYLYQLMENWYDTDLVEKWYCDRNKEEFINHCLDKLNERAIVLPLYLLDHSGLWMSTGKYLCDPGGWDTSHVGFIFVTYEDIRKEYSVKRISKQLRERVRRCLIGEVETYSKYLSGEVYGYIIESIEDENVEESCWGFYEYDYMKEEAESIADYLREKYDKIEYIISTFCR